MKYDIFSSKAPAMPQAGKGTLFVKFILSQASKDMQEPLIPMAFPALSAHLTDVKFRYSDNKDYELCGQMGHLIGPSGIGKAQLTHDVAFWFPPADITNAAFIQNAMACEKMGMRTQYLHLPEVEVADRICGGHRQVSQMVRNIYDCQRAGALRATAEGVTGNPKLRVNISFTSTPDAARQFYKKDLTNGFFGRIPFVYKPRGERCGRIPRQGTYDETFLHTLDSYLLRLTNCKGIFVVKQLNKMADTLAEEMARLADMADDDMLWELSHRSIFSAWKKGAVDSQRPDVVEIHRRLRGVVLLLRPMVEG